MKKKMTQTVQRYEVDLDPRNFRNYQKWLRDLAGNNAVTVLLYGYWEEHKLRGGKRGNYELVKFTVER